MIYRLKMAAKLTIFASRYFSFGKNLKTTFLKEYFNKSWLAHNRKYIYITGKMEILFLWDFRCKTFFARSPLLIYSN